MQDFSTSGVRTQAQLANAKNDDGSRKRRKELDSSAGPPDNLRYLKSTNLGKVGSSRTGGRTLAPRLPATRTTRAAAPGHFGGRFKNARKTPTAPVLMT